MVTNKCPDMALVRRLELMEDSPFPRKTILLHLHVSFVDVDSLDSGRGRSHQ